MSCRVNHELASWRRRLSSQLDGHPHHFMSFHSVSSASYPKCRNVFPFPDSTRRLTPAPTSLPRPTSSRTRAYISRARRRPRTATWGFAPCRPRRPDWYIPHRTWRSISAACEGRRMRRHSAVAEGVAATPRQRHPPSPKDTASAENTRSPTGASR